MASQVKIDEWVWDLICERYAQIENPSPDDRRVMEYIIDKTSRRIAHDAYMSEKRINSYDAVVTPAQND